MGESTHARAYFTYRNHDSFGLHGTDSDANDDWESIHGGFRTDGGTAQYDSWTIQGDIYAEDANQLVSPYYEPIPPYRSVASDNYDASGWNMLAKWQHRFSADNSWTIKTYYDFTNRNELYIEQTQKIFDVEFQHQLQLGTYHDLIWGLGYRNIRDEFGSTFQLLFSSGSATHELFSAFFQDEIMLMPDRLWLTLGSKIEHNDFTGCEIQPSGRLLFKPVQDQTVWAAISRAVRTPSRAERGARFTVGMIPEIPPYPAPLFFWSNEDYDSEDVLAYELGYRIVPLKQLSLDIALFYNDYDNLRTATPLVMPPTSRIQFENKSSGSSYGFELAADWKPESWISFQLGYTWLELDLDANDGETGLDVIVVYEDSSPQHEVSLRSTIDIAEDWQLNLWLRYVDQFSAGGLVALTKKSMIDEYVAFDANISWQLKENIELMLVGQNLFSSGRMEFTSEYLAPLTDVEQSVYGKLNYRF
jgi:iron complex outermembrane receptor protein